MNIVVKKIPGKGKGVFALRDFKKGEIIGTSKGTIISINEALKMSNYALNHMSATGKNKFLLMKSPEKFINHSCNPNVYEYQRKVISIKKIRKSDEITFDYSMNGVTGIDDWKMKCKCKSANCRKVVYGEFFRLPKKLQKKNIIHLDKWFMEGHKEQIKKL